MLRLSGLSLSEISSELKIAKSTASLWLRNTSIPPQATDRLNRLRLEARIKAAKTLSDRRIRSLEKINSGVNTTLSHFKLKDPLLCKVFCSLLFWGEGGKTDSHVAFVNSDPTMIATFMYLIRNGFPLDERKFRILVHIHEYHNDSEIKSFWSKVTDVPLSQFTKSYLKPHTGKTLREGFKGTVRINYYDVKIAQELKAIYNSLSQHILGT